eukprot:GHVS01097931.1.p1 GENE.GHVS01097931.1~~GHVS01097931.1.p1  ORF type:complete len:269 (-),score=98.11 GHVS01097931.1:134-940(-)
MSGPASRADSALANGSSRDWREGSRKDWSCSIRELVELTDDNKEQEEEEEEEEEGQGGVVTTTPSHSKMESALIDFGDEDNTTKATTDRQGSSQMTRWGNSTGSFGEKRKADENNKSATTGSVFDNLLDLEDLSGPGANGGELRGTDQLLISVEDNNSGDASQPPPPPTDFSADVSLCPLPDLLGPFDPSACTLARKRPTGGTAMEASSGLVGMEEAMGGCVVATTATTTTATVHEIGGGTTGGGGGASGGGGDATAGGAKQQQQHTP